MLLNVLFEQHREGSLLALCGIQIGPRLLFKAPFQFLVYKFARLFQTGRSP